MPWRVGRTDSTHARRQATRPQCEQVAARADKSKQQKKKIKELACPVSAACRRSPLLPGVTDKKKMLTRVGFEPTPFRTSGLSRTHPKVLRYILKLAP